MLRRFSSAKTSASRCDKIFEKIWGAGGEGEFDFESFCAGIAAADDNGGGGSGEVFAFAFGEDGSSFGSFVV